MSLPIPPECCVSSLLGPSSPFSDVFNANHCGLDSLSHDFLSAIQISSAEQQALGIPHDDVIDIPATAPPNPSFPPPSRGQKRPASSSPSSPSRRADKENEGIPASNSIDPHVVHPPKIRKVILKLSLAPALQKNSRAK
ncbi:hypothetical protein B0H11DRAFT_1914038 [Mycena galericulata]|nr:hypothetical protein B0H11DRAFT_1914038 [Mycena galericulata]